MTLQHKIQEAMFYGCTLNIRGRFFCLMHHYIPSLSPCRRAWRVQEPRRLGERRGRQEGLPLPQVPAGALLRHRGPRVWLQGRQALLHRQAQQDRQLPSKGNPFISCPFFFFPPGIFTRHLWRHHLDRDVVSRTSARVVIRSQPSSRITAA